MSNELVVHPGTGEIMTPAPIFDREAILRALNLDPRDAGTQALMMVCQQYNLDPLLKHAVLIKGNLYVTRDGLMHVAHASKQFDGIEVEPRDETKTHFVAVATVWRKDMGRPFRYQGRYPKDGQMAFKNGPEMAEKVAECRALRRAFDVSLCSREELWDNEPEAPGAYGSRPGTPSRPVRSGPAPAQITSAPNPPPTDDAPLRAAKSAFARNAKALGLDILNENGKFSNAKLSVLLALVTDLDIEAEGGEWSADDWDHGTELLPGYVEALKAAEAEPATAAAAPEVDADAVDDPFATSAPLEPNPGMSYAEHETTARRGRK